MRQRTQFGFCTWIVLALSSLAWGSQSLNLSGVPNSTGSFSNSSVYSSVTDWRLEGQFDNLGVVSANAGVWEVNSTIAIVLRPTKTLVLTGYDGSEGTSVNLGTATAVRFVAQRNTATGKYTLETWDMQSGAYTFNQGNINVPGAKDFRNLSFSVGSFYEPANLGIHVGFIRWFSSTRNLGGTPPLLINTAATGDLLDFEFEGNLRDSSPNNISFSLASGRPAFVPTAVFPPAVVVNSSLVTARASSSFIVDGTNSFSNVDTPNIQCIWTVLQNRGALTGQNTCNPTFTPPTTGSYTLRFLVTDAIGGSSTKDIQLGAVATDPQDTVVVTDPQMNSILGPLTRFGANPWAWEDTRHKLAADLQIGLQSTTFTDFWNVANPNGTVSAINGSTQVTGSGTQFQTDFCGGAGNTIPIPATSEIYFWYPSADYPGSTGRGRYLIQSCDSQTQMTLTTVYLHSPNANGMTYTVADPVAMDGIWIYSNIPANYYDNVVAFYNLYQRTGLQTYRDAARTLASRFWTGPNWDLGMNYNTNLLNGSYIPAGPARGQSVTGLILWSIDTGQNIWPGVHHLWDFWMYVITTQIAQGQMGDLRELGYVTAGMALCAQYDPDPSYKTMCAAALNNVIDNLWKPLEINNHWTNTSIQRFFGGPGISVHVEDGSTAIRLTGATWSASDFTNSTPLDRSLWFITNPSSFVLSGNTNAAAGGDNLAYKVATVNDSTHVTLTTPYKDLNCAAPAGCEKRMNASIFAGFGTQCFQLGLAMGVMGSYVYDYYTSIGDTVHQTLVQQFVSDGVGWLATYGFDPVDVSIYNGRGFINCEPAPDQVSLCSGAGTRSLTAEVTRAFSFDYLLNGDRHKNVMDALYQGVWAKPGYAAPFPPNGTFLMDIDDPGLPGSYMLDQSAISNKWLGFFFGYGGAATWPAARVGGLNPPSPQVLQVDFDLTTVSNATQVLISLLAPTNVVTTTTCSSSPCSVTVDQRLGRYQMKIDYLSSTGDVLSPGIFNLLPLP